MDSKDHKTTGNQKTALNSTSYKYCIYSLVGIEHNMWCRLLTSLTKAAWSSSSCFLSSLFWAIALAAATFSQTNTSALNYCTARIHCVMIEIPRPNKLWTNYLHDHAIFTQDSISNSRFTETLWRLKSYIIHWNCQQEERIVLLCYFYKRINVQHFSLK